MALATSPAALPADLAVSSARKSGLRSASQQVLPARKARGRRGDVSEPHCLTSRRAGAFAVALATASSIRRGRRCKLTATGEATGGVQEAVVVGAGPAGLAAALMLSQRGWKVKVLEKTPDPASYDPGKGFMYLIDGRGQKCLQELNPQLFTKLVESSVGMADAKIGVLTPKGLAERVNPIKDAARKSYWIPRHAFIGLLLEEAKKKENISLSVEVEIDDIVFDGQFHVTATSSDAPLEGLAGSLLVGADGYRSVVRDKLESFDGAQGHFAVDSRSSPSAGLRYKVLTLPGEFKLDTPAGEKEFSSDGFYAIRGVASSKAKQKLGLIPVRSEFGTRTANLITYEDDVVWEADTLESFKAYAQEQWPHFPLEELVSEKELTRFAQNRGGRFPKPQHCRSAMWLPDDSDHGAAVLIGDSLHSLPPDIGQGVNSALEDVTVLARCLDSAGRGATRTAARAYEDARMPDVRALIDIVQVAAPFQYSQAPWRGRLWNISFLTRFLLNKLVPKFFDLPLFLLIQQSERSYSEIWRLGRRGARRATLVLGGTALAAGAVVRKLLLG